MRRQLKQDGPTDFCSDAERKAAEPSIIARSKPVNITWPELVDIAKENPVHIAKGKPSIIARAKPSRFALAARNEHGSLLLEAAIIMPVFLLFMVLLVSFIRFSIMETALQTAVDQTVRQTAAHIRPALLLMQQGGEPEPDSTGGGGSPQAGNGPPDGSTPPEAAEDVLQEQRLQLPDWSQAAAEAAAFLPDPAGSLAAAVIEGDWQKAGEIAAEPVMIELFQPLLRKSAEGTVLDPSRVRLIHLSLPDLQTGDQAFLTIEAQYEFPMRVPLLGKKIILHRVAAERVWIPDALPASRRDAAPPAEGMLRVVSLHPIPARPGRKATVEAAAAPGASVTLEVRYKSGSSVSKNVGTKVADGEGKVSWTWLVSGNTTSGEWELVLTSSDGAVVTMPFRVQKQSEKSGLTAFSG